MALEHYIVILDDTVADVMTKVNSVSDQHRIASHHTYRDVFKGFSFSGTEASALKIAEDPDVIGVYEDGHFSVASYQFNPPSWGLDRIDQRDLPLNGTFAYDSVDGTRVLVYVLDTGINYHSSLGNRVVGNISFVSSEPLGNMGDCWGHGTQVASIVGGNTYGVARGVTIYNVRVYACTQQTTLVSDWIAGIDWVVANHTAGARAVVNMSLEDPSYTLLGNAVARLVDDGIAVAVAAGNGGVDACGVSPARKGTTDGIVTIGASTSSDQTLYNFGSCVDIFAPGASLRAASPYDPYLEVGFGATSGATPHVAGVLAKFLAISGYPPAQLEQLLKAKATVGRLMNLGAGSPNMLLDSIYRSRP